MNRDRAVDPSTSGAAAGAGGAVERVVVVGGGPAGCAAAHVLTRAGVEVTLLEASNGVGGRTRTERRDGFSIDTGAIFLMGTYDATYRLLDQTGAAGRPRRWKARSVLSHGSRRDRLRFDQPATAVLARSLGWRDRVRLVRSIAKLVVRPGPHPFDADGLADADAGQTLESWSREHLGDRSHDLVVRGFMDPLLATDLSRHSLPFLTSLLARPHRGALRVPERGLDEVCRALSAGASVQTGTRVESIALEGDSVTVTAAGEVIVADAAVIAVEAPTAAGLLRDAVGPHVAAPLLEARCEPLTHVAFGFRVDPWPTAPDLTVPVGGGEQPVIAVLLQDRRRPGSAPEGGQVVSVYFSGEASGTMRTEADAIAAARAAVARHLGHLPEPDLTAVYAREYGLPVAPSGHYATMRSTRKAMPPRIRLAGDYLGHVGIESAVRAGERAATELLALRS